MFCVLARQYTVSQPRRLQLLFHTCGLTAKGVMGDPNLQPLSVQTTEVYVSWFISKFPKLQNSFSYTPIIPQLAHVFLWTSYPLLPSLLSFFVLVIILLTYSLTYQLQSSCGSSPDLALTSGKSTHTRARTRARTHTHTRAFLMLPNC
jgi:hypothetical protein